MKAALLRAACLALCVATAAAQTLTVTNNLGYTVVEEVTLNNIGLPTTEVVSTILGAAMSTSPSSTKVPTTSSAPTTAPTTATTPTTSPAVAAAQPQGPVEDSPTAVAAGPTAYVYSTTNAAGATITVNAIFTPTYEPTTDAVPTGSGTILQYSAWLSAIGTHTVPASAAAPRWRAAWLPAAGATLLGVVGGALMIFA